MGPGVQALSRRAGPRPDEQVRWAEWAVALLLTVLALGLHLTFATHAGPLWRDEANSAALATALSPREAVEALSYDSFPLLPTIVLRGWAALGWGNSDAGFRVLGLLVGVAFLGFLWLAAHRYGSGPPLLSLALVGVSPLVVIAVDSVRPHGIGVVAMGLTALLVGRAIALPSRGRLLAAAVVAVASVQCLYQNAFLLLAVCIAAIAAAPGTARKRVALGVLGVGGLAALSLVPYAGAIRSAQDWSSLAQIPRMDLGRVLTVFARALESSGALGIWAWSGTALAALWALARQDREGTGDADRTPIRFGALAAWAGGILFLSVMVFSRLLTQTWYYVPLLALAAPCLERCVHGLASSRTARVARLLAVLAITVSGVTGWRLVSERRTNLDTVAEFLEREAAQGDVIAIGPWYLAISFHRYYQGNVPWSTLPPLAETRIHRFDLLKAALRNPDPVAPLLQSMGRALDSGHRVWLVVESLSSSGDGTPPSGSAQPSAAAQEHAVTFGAWSERTTNFLMERADTLEVIPLGLDRPVQALERVGLITVSGRPPGADTGSPP